MTGELAYIHSVERKEGCRMALSIVIWSLALFFIITGICDYHSRKPAGIYTNVKMAELDKITDLRAYNRAVGKLALGYGVVFIFIALISHFVKEETVGILILISTLPGTIIMVIIYETIISKKYIPHN